MAGETKGTSSTASKSDAPAGAYAAGDVVRDSELGDGHVLVVEVTDETVYVAPLTVVALDRKTVEQARAERERAEQDAAR